MTGAFRSFEPTAGLFVISLSWPPLSRSSRRECTENIKRPRRKKKEIYIEKSTKRPNNLAEMEWKPSRMLAEENGGVNGSSPINTWDGCDERRKPELRKSQPQEADE
jgi:hypothetical protein